MIVTRLQIPELADLDFAAGCALLVDKPLEWTSFNVVSKIRYLIRHHLGVKKFKVGHAGTLDPLATGLLIICTGKMTKSITDFMGQEKEYLATLSLGASRPSYDMETEIDHEFPYEHIDRDLIDKTLENFKGDIMQVPPIFSAKQVNGKRAYESARAGKELKLAACSVNISELEVERFESPELDLRVRCSKGTYIRSLAHDVGHALESGAYLSQLRRTASGPYRVEDALTIEDLVAALGR